MSTSQKIEANPQNLILSLVALNLVLFCASLAIGYSRFDIIAAAMDWVQQRNTLPALIFAELRLPRAILGIMVGFTLGLSGAAMQGYLRNPLAEPGVMGVSGAASLGAVMMFYSGFAGLFMLAMPLAAILSAVLAIFVLQKIAGKGANVTTLVLCGVASNSLAAAMTALVLNLSPNPYAALEIMFWLMGSLADRSQSHVLMALPFVLTGWVLILSCASSLDGLTLGEDTARSLGINLRALQKRLMVGTALCVGSSVAVSGAIGFIGLVVPHILRPFVGHRPGRLLFVSGLGGAVLTLAADIAVRLIGSVPELQLGVVTALIGAPFLFMLIMSNRRGLR